jgi:hypothetical protein
MTETNTLSKPPRQTVPGTNNLGHPADVLLALIVTLLAPIFFAASGGDMQLARMAAAETVIAYRARNHADLISVSQIAAFGLAAVSSLSLSMGDKLSLSMALRLRGNANACNRSAEQNRCAVKENRFETETPVTTPPETDIDFDESAVLAMVATTLERAAGADASVQATEPVVVPAPVETQAAAAPAMATGPRQALWADAMAVVAAEFAVDLPGLPPAQRKAITNRAAALSSCASDLLCGKVAQGQPPVDLTGMMRQNPI